MAILQDQVFPSPPLDPAFGGGTKKKQEDDASFKSAAYLRQMARWKVVSDVQAGTDHMRSCGETYLPKAPAEKPMEYQRRLGVAELFNGMGRTITGLVGMVFRRNPKLEEDMPEQLKKDWENIDGAGAHGDIFSKVVFADAVGLGHAGILVDYPTVPNAEELTKADVEDKNLRPYWVGYSAPQILAPRFVQEGGRMILSQLVLMEVVTEPEGEFGEKIVRRYRVLRRVKNVITGESTVMFILFKEVESRSGKTVKLVEERRGVISKQKEIPFAIVYAGERLGVCETRPPLLDLAYTNIAHWQVQSDHRHSLHIASVPILVFKGRDVSDQATKDQMVGPNIGVDVDKDGDVMYVEHSGSALGQTREELKDLENRMAAQGLAMLQRETRSAETAEAKRIDKAEQDSALATAARGLSDALEQAFIFHAAYYGLEMKAGSLTVNQEFENLSFDPAMIAALSTLQVAGQISLDTLWSMLESGNVLPEDFDADLERVKVTLGEPNRIDPNLEAENEREEEKEKEEEKEDGEKPPIPEGDVS